MKVCIVHDWLTGMRGGERVLEIFLKMFPAAIIYTLFHIKGSVSEQIERQRIETSFLQHFPFIRKHYRHYLPLFPMAIESFDVRKYDLVISLNHCVSHGIIPSSSSIHICYSFTPMRYAWDRFHDYFGRDRVGAISRPFIGFCMQGLRIWDIVASNRVTSYVTISKYIASKIKRYYGRVADVVYPPVDSSFFVDPLEPEDYFLIVSALAPYKNIDLAIKAFNLSGLPLIIIGDGPDFKRLKKLALGNIQFLGWQPDDVLRDYYRRCRALIFPGEEDFGITPLEAQASGKPVIALDRGGVKEAVIPGETGVFFKDPTPESLKKVVEDFDTFTYSSSIIQKHAAKFKEEIFIKRMNAIITNILDRNMG